MLICRSVLDDEDVGDSNGDTSQWGKPRAFRAFVALSRPYSTLIRPQQLMLLVHHATTYVVFVCERAFGRLLASG